VKAKYHPARCERAREPCIYWALRLWCESESVFLKTVFSVAGNSSFGLGFIIFSEKCNNFTEIFVYMQPKS